MSARDEAGQTLAAEAADSNKALDIKQLEVRALTLLTTGIYKPQEESRPQSATMAVPEAETGVLFLVVGVVIIAV